MLASCSFSLLEIWGDHFFEVMDLFYHELFHTEVQNVTYKNVFKYLHFNSFLILKWESFFFFSWVQAVVGISKQVRRCYWCQCWGRGDSFSFLSCWLFHLHRWTVRIKGLVLGLCSWAIALTPKEAGRGWWPFCPLTFLMSPFPTFPTLKLTLLNLKTSALHTGVFLVTNQITLFD